MVLCHYQILLDLLALSSRMFSVVRNQKAQHQRAETRENLRVHGIKKNTRRPGHRPSWKRLWISSSVISLPLPFRLNWFSHFSFPTCSQEIYLKNWRSLNFQRTPTPLSVYFKSSYSLNLLSLLVHQRLGIFLNMLYQNANIYTITVSYSLPFLSCLCLLENLFLPPHVKFDFFFS